MKKHYLLLVLLLSLSAVAFAFADWQNFNVDDRVTVKLPATPQEVDMAKLMASQGKSNPAITNQTTRLFVVMNEDGMYQVMRVELTGMEGVEGEIKRASYYDGVIDGALRPQQGTVLTRTTFQTAAGEGIEVKYRGVNRGTGKKGIKYMRSLLVGRTGYTLNFLPRDQQDSTGTSGSAQRQQFFNSIVVKPSK